VKYDEVHIDSINQLLEALAGQYKPLEEIIWFRGHADCEWALTPSLFRAPYKLEHESALLNRFRQNALSLLSYRPEKSWEWLFLMRHHGCPTRLLDWTESPLVALYFACQSNPKHESKDGHLWCLSPTALNEQMGITGSHPGDIPAFGHGPYLDEFMPEKIFTPGIRRQPAAALAPREIGRMVSQQSVFTIHHQRAEPIEAYGDKQHLWRLRIPAPKKEHIRSQLAVLGINRLSIFPDLESAALVAMEAIRG
jgi:hypothetical protein